MQVQLDPLGDLRLDNLQTIDFRVDKTLPMDIRTACTPKENADAKPGSWNRFFITMKGDRCTVVLNEKTIIDNAQLPGIPAEGPIALQYHNDEIEFAICWRSTVLQARGGDTIRQR